MSRTAYTFDHGPTTNPPRPATRSKLQSEQDRIRNTVTRTTTSTIVFTLTHLWSRQGRCAAGGHVGAGTALVCEGFRRKQASPSAAPVCDVWIEKGQSRHADSQPLYSSLSLACMTTPDRRRRPHTTTEEAPADGHDNWRPEPNGSYGRACVVFEGRAMRPPSGLRGPPTIESRRSSDDERKRAGRLLSSSFLLWAFLAGGVLAWRRPKSNCHGAGRSNAFPTRWKGSTIHQRVRIDLTGQRAPARFCYLLAWAVGPVRIKQDLIASLSSACVAPRVSASVSHASITLAHARLAFRVLGRGEGRGDDRTRTDWTNTHRHTNSRGVSSIKSSRRLPRP